MLKVVKLRLYPNEEQQEALAQSFGNCRWLWNYCLNLMNQTYRDVDNNQVIATENLNVKGMMKNHCLAKAIGQVGWGMFMTMLKYKAENDGTTYVEVDRFFPSSKTCHVCLNQVGNLPLDIRQWTCENCQTKHDRDVNASINLREEGLRILRVRNSEETSECKTHSRQTCGTRDKAYRPDVSRSRGGRKKSTIPLSVG